MSLTKLIRVLSICIETLVLLQISIISFYAILFTSKVNISSGSKEIIMLCAGVLASIINVWLLYLIVNHVIKRTIKKENKAFMTLKITLLIYFLFGVLLLFTVFVLEDDIARYLFMGFLFTLLMYLASLFFHRNARA